jgi:regulator of replication initiation timing
VSLGLAKKKAAQITSDMIYREPQSAEYEQLNSRREKETERSYSRGLNIATPVHERKPSAGKIEPTSHFNYASALDKIVISSDKPSPARPATGLVPPTASFQPYPSSQIYQSDNTYGGIPRPNIVSAQGFNQTVKYSSSNVQEQPSVSARKETSASGLSLRAGSRDRILQEDKEKLKSGGKSHFNTMNSNASSTDHLKKDLSRKGSDFVAQLSNYEGAGYSASSFNNFKDASKKPLYPMLDPDSLSDDKGFGLLHPNLAYPSDPPSLSSTFKDYPAHSIKSFPDLTTTALTGTSSKKQAAFGEAEPETRYKLEQCEAQIRELESKNSVLSQSVKDLMKENSKLKLSLEQLAKQSPNIEKVRKEKELMERQNEKQQQDLQQLQKENESFKKDNSEIIGQYKLLKDILMNMARSFKTIVEDEWEVRLDSPSRSSTRRSSSTTKRRT